MVYFFSYFSKKKRLYPSRTETFEYLTTYENTFF